MANDEAAEDVVSEAYLLAARSFHLFDPTRTKFTTWVTSIALNCMRSHYRKNRPTAALDETPEEKTAVYGEQDIIDDQDLIEHLLEHLDDEERSLVFMKYYEGKRNIEIANELDMNASTVSTKLARAISKMRASITE